MIAVKNADGSFAPVIDETPHSTVELDLNWVRSDQAKAEIRLYKLKASGQAADELGMLVVKDLPENSFGAGVIKLNLSIDTNGDLCAQAGLLGEPAVSARFPLAIPKKIEKTEKVEKKIEKIVKSKAKGRSFPYRILAIAMLVLSALQVIAITLRISNFW